VTEPIPKSCCCTTEGLSFAAGVQSEEQIRALFSGTQPLDTEDLLGLLNEAHPLYSGLGGPAVVRIRGTLLLALARGPLPEEALPYVLEELESAHDAYLTAVAAHVLRAASSPDSAHVEPLLSALFYIRHRDDMVRLAEYGGHGGASERTTAMAEVLRTIGWLGGTGRAALPRLKALRDEQPGPTTIAGIDAAVAAIEVVPTVAASTVAAPSCCASRSAAIEPRPAPADDISQIELQDQQGECFRFSEFFVGKPCIVVFFYTRCENPTKCPLTVSKLGRLQRLLLQEGLADAIRTAAITYDPDFDLPARLEQYGRSWGAKTGPDHRLLRTTGDFAPVQAWFELGVNYASSVVNRHRLEAYVLDANGQISAVITRLRWNERDLLERARALLGAAASQPAVGTSS